MPHLTVEYTDNLYAFDARKALMTLNQVLVASGHFEGPDIKSRAIRLDTYLLGTSTASHAFVHVTLALLSGRQPAEKRMLADSLLAALAGSWTTLMGTEIQLTVETRELDALSYAKATK